MEDAVNATIELMEAPTAAIKIRTSYNVSGMSFSPKEIYDCIKMHQPDFKIKYEPDFRQSIADSWPKSIDDSAAQNDWGWKAKFDLTKMSAEILTNCQPTLIIIRNKITICTNNINPLLAKKLNL
jgi:nucleoside-diphosphate-sugar epimerase